MDHSVTSKIKIALLLLLVAAAGFATACIKEPPPAPQPVSPQAPVEMPAPSAPTAAPTPGASIVIPTPMVAPPAPVIPVMPAPQAPEPEAQPAPFSKPENGVFKPGTIVVTWPLYLNVSAPEESVIKNSFMKVEGSTLPTSVVTVNGNIAALDETGKFSVPVTLEEGPNAIEIVASDFQGNQRSSIVSVIRLPQ